MKPIIVIMSGGILITTVVTSPVYHDVMYLVVYPNTFYAVPLLHPFVYGLYFKEIHQPMMKRMKMLLCCSKFNTATVAPHTLRTAWM